MSGYVRVEEIARGGMGHVDLVLRQEGSFRRLYAMKRLNQSLREDPELIAMFLDEARVAGLIRHQNVVSVLDVGEDDEGPFLVMDFVDGLPLSEVFREHESVHEKLPVQVAIDIIRQVAEALHAAHELSSHDGQALSVVHRDVSPHNVLLGFDGTVKLTDFGVAKALGRQTATTTDVLKGKVSYMSPEQLRFEELDRRSDLFSLGVVLYELLALERLYFHPDVSKSARAVLDDPPPDIGEKRGDVPDALVMLLFDLLAKQKEHRPATAKEVADRLQEIALEQMELEEPLPLSVFVEERYGKLHEAEAERRNRAVRSAEAEALTGESAEPTRARSPKRSRLAWLLPAAILVAAGVGLAFGLTVGSGAEAETETGSGSETESETNGNENGEVGGEPSHTETRDGPPTPSWQETGAAGTGSAPANHDDEPHLGDGPRPDSQREGSSPTASAAPSEPETGPETAPRPRMRPRMRRRSMRTDEVRDERLWGWE
jgi:serine/threonine-protein kinase